MTDREKALDLIHRYAHEVAAWLPRKQREDVKQELRALLEETLEERARAAGRPADEGLAVEVLREFGQPGKVALRYRAEPQYLIGPEWFPYYIFWSMIVLIGVAAVFGLALLVPALGGPGDRLPDLLQRHGLLDMALNYFQLAVMNLGFLTLVFAVLERLVKQKPGDKPEEWNPRDLPAVKDPDRISEGDLVFKIYAIAVLAALLNFYPQWFGFIFFTDEGARAIPLSRLGISLPATLMNIWWAGALTLNMWLLRERRWTRETRWVELMLGVFGAFILWVVIAASNLPDVESWKDFVDPRRVEKLAWFGNSAVTFVMKAALVITLVETAVRLFRVLRRYPVTP
jgi:hypothetical protein